MGPTRGRQDPGGPQVGPMNLAIRVSIITDNITTERKNTQQIYTQILCDMFYISG